MPISAPHSHVAKEPLLDIDNLSVSYHRVPILKAISLAIYPGEFIGLIGPNGAGKSTLFKAILGLIPRKGTVQQHSGGTIGYVQQRANIQERQVPISVLEVVKLGSKGNLEQAKTALASVGMSYHAHKPFSQLSGGQQQKVYIAKALASQPCMLVMDEPTTGIDEQSQTEFYQLLQKLQHQGMTIVMISHNIDAVLKLVDRVICLNQTILYDGPPTHFEPDTYLPKFYTQQHQIIHHRALQKKVGRQPLAASRKKPTANGKQQTASSLRQEAP